MTKTVLAAHSIISLSIFIAAIVWLYPASARTLLAFEPGDVIGVQVACEKAESVIKVLSAGPGVNPGVTDCFQTDMVFPCIVQGYAGEVKDNGRVTYRVLQCNPLAPLGLDTVFTAERVEQFES